MNLKLLVLLLFSGLNLYGAGLNYRPIIPFTNSLSVTPASSNNMTIWLVADDLSGYANNTQIDYWTNRMSGKVGFTNYVAGVIKSNSIVNAHASLYFDGTGFLTAIQQNNWAYYVNESSCTMFYVLRQRSTRAQAELFNWASSGESIILFATYNDILFFDFPDQTAGTGRVQSNQPVGWDDAWHVLEVHKGSGSSEILVDGTSLVSGATANNLTVADSSVNWYLGSGSGLTFMGDLAEVRVFNDDKSSSERAVIRAELKTTYNTP